MHKLSKRERELLTEHRTINPRSRALTIIRFVKNTSASKQRGCVLCDEVGPSWCSRYPITKQAEAWEAAHRAVHGV